MASIIAPKNHLLTLRIERKDVVALDKLASKEGESRSVILRRFVRQGLGPLPDPKAAV